MGNSVSTASASIVCCFSMACHKSESPSSRASVRIMQLETALPNAADIFWDFNATLKLSEREPNFTTSVSGCVMAAKVPPASKDSFFKVAIASAESAASCCNIAMADRSSSNLARILECYFLVISISDCNQLTVYSCCFLVSDY